MIFRSFSAARRETSSRRIVGAEEAAAFLKKHPLPEEFLKKNKEKSKK